MATRWHVPDDAGPEGYSTIPRELLDRWRAAVRERDRRADEARRCAWLRARGHVPAARR